MDAQHSLGSRCSRRPKKLCIRCPPPQHPQLYHSLPVPLHSTQQPGGATNTEGQTHSLALLLRSRTASFPPAMDGARRRCWRVLFTADSCQRDSALHVNDSFAPCHHRHLVPSQARLSLCPACTTLALVLPTDFASGGGEAALASRGGGPAILLTGQTKPYQCLLV